MIDAMTAMQQTEAEFQASVLQLAHAARWEHYHTYDSRKSVAGFPDLVLVRSTRCIFAELKASGKKPTESQLHWLHTLAATGNEVYVWSPDDWDDIEMVLARNAAATERALLSTSYYHYARSQAHRFAWLRDFFNI